MIIKLKNAAAINLNAQPADFATLNDFFEFADFLKANHPALYEAEWKWLLEEEEAA